MSDILTVGELKELIKDVPDDYIVITEGCDCVGASDRIEPDPSDKTLLIGRAHAWRGGGFPDLGDR